jgi:predicted pyridoxine 5'-phosphate oxidase superfamily flavin-nucleotide-binding protein
MTFHEGEIAVQQRAGVGQLAGRVGAGIRSTIPTAAAEFLRDQPWLVLGSADEAGHMWASLLIGPPGFVRARDERTVHIGAAPLPSDPLAVRPAVGDAVGLLALDFATRRRMRLNGEVLERTARSMVVGARQVYANCPKYIQRRTWDAPVPAVSPTQAWRGGYLTDEQRRWIGQADTFFIASSHPQGGADASHRGGQPGFVRVESPTRLVFPDYAGNNMFNTLGNLTANPRAGLLFVDFDEGRTLQLSGEARIDWDSRRTAEFVGAERVVELSVEQVVEVRGASFLRARLVDYSPFNPA